MSNAEFIKSIPYNAAGIYKLTAPNGKVYIGQSTFLRKRLYQYNNKCNDGKIGEAVNKYGFENFTIEILEYIDKDGDYKTNLLLREIHYIKLYNTIEDGLNVSLLRESNINKREFDKSKSVPITLGAFKKAIGSKNAVLDNLIQYYDNGIKKYVGQNIFPIEHNEGIRFGDKSYRFVILDTVINYERDCKLIQANINTIYGGNIGHRLRVAKPKEELEYFINESNNDSHYIVMGLLDLIRIILKDQNPNNGGYKKFMDYKNLFMNYSYEGEAEKKASWDNLLVKLRASRKKGPSKRNNICRIRNKGNRIPKQKPIQSIKFKEPFYRKTTKMLLKANKMHQLNKLMEFIATLDDYDGDLARKYLSEL